MAGPAAPQQQSKAMSADVLQPGSLLSTGYDETLKTHDWTKRLTSAGEVRTPADFGTPVVSAFAPPAPSHSTHCIIGFSGTTSSTIDGTNTSGTGVGGKLCIYKKRDWSVQHVLSGHDGGVSALAVHPSGKLALSGGVSDGKLKLWDLTKGRLAFCYKLEPARMIGQKAKFDSISSITWSTDDDGAHYALSHGSHVTAREVATGKTLLDVELPSRVHQVAFMQVPEGLFLVAACNDGSLPVLAVEEIDDDDDKQQTRRAIMAIEPVESHLAREERFKCIQHVRDYHVVTANSAGVVSLMNLQGAIRMITTEDAGDVDDDIDSNDSRGDDDDDKSSSSGGEMELAVDIVDSVRLGTGARITCLTAWCRRSDDETFNENQSLDGVTTESRRHTMDQKAEKSKPEKLDDARKRKMDKLVDGLSMDEDAVKRARKLVEKAKKLSQKKANKQHGIKKGKKKQSRE